MKKLSLCLLIVVLLLSTVLTGCGEKDKAPETIDLVGNWKQTNGSDESYQAAVITESTIEIYWVSDGGDTRSLYWAGSVILPGEGAASPYEWISQNDHEKTDFSMLASSDDTKTFTYNDGEISYSASALGTTKTIRLEKTEG